MGDWDLGQEGYGMRFDDDFLSNQLLRELILLELEARGLRPLLLETRKSNFFKLKNTIVVDVDVDDIKTIMMNLVTLHTYI